MQNKFFWHVSYTIRKTIFSSISEYTSKLENSIGNENCKPAFSLFLHCSRTVTQNGNTRRPHFSIPFWHFSYTIWKPFLSSLGKDWYGFPKLNRHYERQLSSQTPYLGLCVRAKRSCSFQTQLLGLRPIPFCRKFFSLSKYAIKRCQKFTLKRVMASSVSHWEMHL